MLGQSRMQVWTNINFYDADIFCVDHVDQRVFKFEVIINVLVSSFRFICIPVLWVYGNFKI